LPFARRQSPIAFFSAAGEISTSGSGTWATRSTSCSLAPIGLTVVRSAVDP
jgi:hypothetical protein